MKNLNERREMLKKSGVQLRELKITLKNENRTKGYAFYDKLYELKEHARYFGLIHTLLKKRPDLFEDEIPFLELGLPKIKSIIIELGIETKWKSEEKELKSSLLIKAFESL